MEDEHRSQITELERNLTDVKRQHTKTGLFVIYSQNAVKQNK